MPSSDSSLDSLKSKRMQGALSKPISSQTTSAATMTLNRKAQTHKTELDSSAPK